MKDKKQLIISILIIVVVVLLCLGLYRLSLADPLIGKIAILVVIGIFFGYFFARK